MRTVLQLFAAIALFLGSPDATAQLCKWAGADGSVHYAERCPAGAATVALEPAPSQERIEAAIRAYQRPEPATESETATAAPIEFQPRLESMTIPWDEITCPSAGRKRHVDRMDAACDRARAAHIAPLRAEAIERCLDGLYDDRGWCAQHFEDFLDAAWVGRLDNPRAFDFLTECQVALKCRQEAGLPERDRHYPWLVRP